MNKLFSLSLAIWAVSALACSYDTDYNRPETCDHTSYKTFCDNNLLVSCGSDDRLVEVMCKDSCDSKTLACIGGTVEEDCGGVDSKGMCDGNVAKKCVSGVLLTQACASGTVCGKRSDGQVDCLNENVQYTVGAKCPSEITYDGICDGNKAVYCDKNGNVAVDDCGSNKCMVKNSYSIPFAECYINCNGLDYAGKCVGGGFEYCDDTEGLIHITCENGSTCQLTADEVYGCI